VEGVRPGRTFRRRNPGMLRSGFHQATQRTASVDGLFHAVPNSRALRTKAAARGWSLGSLTAKLLGPLDHHGVLFGTEVQELILETLSLPSECV
jgi:hypothetical protein